jgi:hypothetical protein
MDQRSKFKEIILKFLEENIGKSLEDIGISNSKSEIGLQLLRK